MGSVHLSVDSGVARLELDNPDHRNALDPEMARTVVELCDSIDDDPTIGSAVVCGAGGTFCSGAERDVLAEVGTAPLAPDHYSALGEIYRAFTRVGELQVPTVACVRGAAVGAGVNLMLATDLRILADDARVISGFLRIGLHPGGGHFGLLGRLGGRELAAALGIFGMEMSAARAVELGLAWQAAPSDQVEALAFEAAARAGADPALARMAIASLRAELGPPALPWSAGLAVERAPQLWSMARRTP
jgi:enoyl-CoA hydratase